MIIPIIIAYALATSDKWRKTEAEKKEREKNNLNSELQHLKYQLQPHFFFNSLNTIYALIERSPEMAQETVHSLAKLMRYMLYETESGKVNLSEDIAFMKQYIELMKLRLSDKTKINVNFPCPGQHYEIAPLLFISLIENAFKHGISATQPSELLFSLKVDEGRIRFFAENTNFPKTEKDKSGSGIGIVNLKKRLELAYPGRHTFQTKVEGNLFSVLLEIDTKQVLYAN
jgi:LytS/YehU family sensor histidine kinase